MAPTQTAKREHRVNRAARGTTPFLWSAPASLRYPLPLRRADRRRALRTIPTAPVRGERVRSASPRNGRDTMNAANVGTEALSDDLVVSQWYDRQSPSFMDVPERRLLLAVLVDAIRCLQSNDERQRTQVAAWVRGENGNARLSFRSLCEGLGLDLAPLGHRLLALTATDAKPLYQRRPSRPSKLRVGRRERQPPQPIRSGLGRVIAAGQSG